MDLLNYKIIKDWLDYIIHHVTKLWQGSINQYSICKRGKEKEMNLPDYIGIKRNCNKAVLCVVKKIEHSTTGFPVYETFRSTRWFHYKSQTNQQPIRVKLTNQQPITVVPELMKLTHFFSYLSDSKDQTVIEKVLLAMIDAINPNKFRFEFLKFAIWINLDSPSKTRNQN